MRRFLLLTAFVCFTVFAFAAEAPAKKPVIKIGVILPLTGNSDHLGIPLREYIQYKAAHFPKDSRFEYKLIFTDDQCTQRQTLSEAHRLVEWEGVDILTTFFSGPGSVVAPFALQKKIPHLMWSFNTKPVDGVFNFDHVTPTEKSAEMVTQRAEKLGYKKVALLVMRNAGGESVLKSMEDYRSQSKLEWTTCVRFNPGERDFRMTLYKIRETKPELFFVYAIDPELPIILRQMHEIGWKIPVTSVSIFDLDHDNPLLEGSWYTGSDVPKQSFRKWYEDTFKKISPYGVGTFDDYMEFIYRACENYQGAGKPTGEQIAAYLRNIKDYDGACGKVSCNEKGVFETAPTLLTIKNGTVTPIEE